MNIGTNPMTKNLWDALFIKSWYIYIYIERERERDTKLRENQIRFQIGIQ